MRVIFLTHYFRPEAGAPQTRISALAQGLFERGWEVVVHAPPPHYPDGIVQQPYRNKPFGRTRSGGVTVVRSAVYPAVNRGFARRLLNHASFASSALLTAPLAGAADVVVVESPPLFLAGSAIAYARAKRARLVMNVADRWPASAVELGALRDRRAVRAAEWLEATCYRAAAAVTVPTRGLAHELSQHPAAAGKVHWMPPAVDVDRFTAAPPIDSVPGPLRVLYAGTVGLAHGIETLVAAAEQLGPDRVHVTIAGGGAEHGIVTEAAGRLSNVKALGVVDPVLVPELYATNDVAVVLLRDRPLFRSALPTKLLEAFAAGRPVVVSASGESAELVRDERSGLAVPPESSHELAAAFELLRRDRGLRERLGASGRRLAVDRFARAASVADWDRLLRAGADQGVI
jgi:colanic acid biosynthesis glycosyl transferase WcaI